MRRSINRITLGLVIAVALIGVAGCGDVAAKVEAAENPAPAGTYEGVEVSSRVSINEKANYAWVIDGTTYDAVADADTNYKVNGESVSSSEFNDAVNNEGLYEGENEDSFDDTYNLRVQPDGVLLEVDLITGE